MRLRHFPKIAIFALLAALLAGCASSGKRPQGEVLGEAEHLDNLDALWNALDRSIRERDHARFEQLVTQESYDWLDTLILSIERMPEEELRERPFEEMFIVLGVRFLYRNHEIDSYHRDDVLPAVMSQHPLDRMFARKDLGEFWYEDDRAWRGLKRASGVPLFCFAKENNAWKLDLRQTLSKVLRGFESVGAKKQIDMPDAIIYILDRHPRYEADRGLLRP